MVQMLLAEGMLLCSLFWAFCWLGTGSDEKNIRNFSTYPDEVQKIVKARPELSGNIRQRGPAAIFAGNLLLFTALLFAMGLLTRQEYFAGNFLNTLLLGQALNLFDFLVIDLLWWRHTRTKPPMMPPITKFRTNRAAPPPRESPPARSRRTSDGCRRAGRRVSRAGEDPAPHPSCRRI